MQLITLLASLVLLGNFAQAAKYTVWVGLEDTKLGLEVNRNYPEVLRIHPGDTVVFQQMSIDPHTVTFHPGTPLPDLFGPGGVLNMPVFLRTNVTQPYDGSYFVSSGFMMKGGGETRFPLTFSTVGEFKYGCSVHGPVQNGSIVVVEKKVKIPSPSDIVKRHAKWAKNIRKRAPKIYAQALASVPKRVKNEDGTRTHYVSVGYMKGIFEFMAFFPRILEVRPGDTVEYYGSIFHTISFLNGSPLPPLVVPNQLGQLALNPQIILPANASVPLTRNGYINSGLIVDPTIKFPLKIGDIQGTIPYTCIIHDANGMRAKLIVKKP